MCAHLGCYSLGRVMNCGVLTCLEHDLSTAPLATPKGVEPADRPAAVAVGLAPERPRPTRQVAYTAAGREARSGRHRVRGVVGRDGQGTEGPGHDG